MSRPSHSRFYPYISTPGFPKLSLFLRFPHQKPVNAPHFHHTCYMPRPSHSRFYHSNNKLSLFRLHQNISPGPKLTVGMFRNRIRFYGEQLLAPRPSTKLEDRLLSAVRVCLFNTFESTLHIGGRFSIRNLPWWQGPIYCHIYQCACFLFFVFNYYIWPICCNSLSVCTTWFHNTVTSPSSHTGFGMCVYHLPEVSVPKALHIE